jgi:hypothetical protein
MAKRRGPRVPKEFKDLFMARVRAARLAVRHKYRTVRDFEKAMGLEPDSWKHFEGGRASMLPHHLVSLFCHLTGVSSDSLFEWHQAAQSSPRPTAPTDRRRRHAA